MSASGTAMLGSAGGGRSSGRGACSGRLGPGRTGPIRFGACSWAIRTGCGGAGGKSCADSEVTHGEAKATRAITRGETGRSVMEVAPAKSRGHDVSSLRPVLSTANHSTIGSAPRCHVQRVQMACLRGIGVVICHWLRENPSSRLEFGARSQSGHEVSLTTSRRRSDVTPPLTQFARMRGALPRLPPSLPPRKARCVVGQPVSD